MRKDASRYGRKADWRLIAERIYGPRENDPKWRAWLADVVAKAPSKRSAAEKQAVAYAMSKGNPNAP